MQPDTIPEFCKEGEGLNQKFFCFFFAQKLYNLGPVLNKLMQHQCVTDKGLSFQPLGNFCDFAREITILSFDAYLITFCTVLKPYE